MLNAVKKSATKVATTGAILASSVTSAFAQAQYVGGVTAGTQGELIGFITGFLNLVIGLAGLIAVAYLIYSGILYITSNGDEGKVEKATKGITYAVIGLIICFISVLIVNFVVGEVLA